MLRKSGLFKYNLAAKFDFMKGKEIKLHFFFPK